MPFPSSHEGIFAAQQGEALQRRSRQNIHGALECMGLEVSANEDMPRLYVDLPPGMCNKLC